MFIVKKSSIVLLTLILNAMKKQSAVTSLITPGDFNVLMKCYLELIRWRDMFVLLARLVPDFKLASYDTLVDDYKFMLNYIELKDSIINLGYLRSLARSIELIQKANRHVDAEVYSGAFIALKETKACLITIYELYSEPTDE